MGRDHDLQNLGQIHNGRYAVQKPETFADRRSASTSAVDEPRSGLRMQASMTRSLLRDPIVPVIVSSPAM
jgi:hypothetical protein